MLGGHDGLLLMQKVVLRGHTYCTWWGPLSANGTHVFGDLGKYNTETKEREANEP